MASPVPTLLAPAAPATRCTLMGLSDRLAGLRPGGFARAVGVLVGGTAIGHAVTAAAMPVLTRLYTPSDFGLLAVFSAVFAIVAVAACLRYEIAIALPPTDDEAANLLGVAVAAAVLVSAANALVVLPFAPEVAAWLGQPALARYLWILPLCTLLAGVYAALQYWHVRQRQFGCLACTRIGQSAAASGSQIALGLAGAGPVGLLAGPLVNAAAGCGGALWGVLRQDRRALRTIAAAPMWQAACAHSRFPRYSAAEALANSASIQLPVMLIAALGSGAEAGHLMLAMYVVQAPMALLGNAVSQVYLSRAPLELRAGTLGRFTADVIGGLMRAGIGPLVALGIVAPFLFAPLFGDAWVRAGIVTAWLTPWFVMHFLTAPVSMALHVAGRQRLALLLQLMGLGLRVSAVLIGARLVEGRLSEAYALSGLFFYSIYLAVILRATRCALVDLVQAARRAMPTTVAWIAAAFVVAAMTQLGTGS
jgi:O-antigen/teichoic acid export membrane protein